MFLLKTSRRQLTSMNCSHHMMMLMLLMVVITAMSAMLQTITSKDAADDCSRQ